MAQRSAAQLKADFLDYDPKDYNDNLIDSFAVGTAQQTGNVWYVDPTNGSDTANSGQGKDSAYATMQTAVDAASAGDTIIRMPGTEQITAAITFDVAGLTVIASNYGVAPTEGSEEAFSTYAAAAYTDGPAAIISQPCALIGLEFASRDTADAAANTAAGSSAAIAIDDGANFTYIKNCRFPRWWANVAAVKVIGNSYGTIEGCVFEGAFTAAIWYTSGPVHNPTHNRVVGNEFIQCANCVEYEVGTGSDANRVLFNTTQHVTQFLDTNGETSSPRSIYAGNYLDFATLAASFDQLNIAAMEAIGWISIDNHVRDT